MKALRTYGLVATFALVLFVSTQLIWMFCPALDVIDTVAWSVFIAVAASMIFTVATEPKQEQRKADWKVNRAGINFLAQKSKKRSVS